MTSSLSHSSTTANLRAATNVSPQQQRLKKSLFRNRFDVIKRLGRGGFSTTYLAQDVTAAYAQPCVIKQLRYKTKYRPDTVDGAFEAERNQRRFQREARIMARIGRHSQLPCLLDHFVEKGRFYLIQEYIAGPTLNQVLHSSGPLKEAQVKTFLREMIPLIRYVHRHNLLHLDIKPANIIRRQSDQKLALIDFGAVRQYVDGATHRPVGSTGTVGFASAEQLAGQPTPASDIYGLGVTCLYLLTGCPPLDFATSPKGQDLCWQKSVQVSTHLTHVLQKMLAPAAEHRFQSVDALERALDLEGHYDKLKPCMTSEPFSPDCFKRPTTCQIEEYASASGKSYTARQAASIRRWQQRRRQFKSFVPK